MSLLSSRLYPVRSPSSSALYCVSWDVAWDDVCPIVGDLQETILEIAILTPNCIGFSSLRFYRNISIQNISKEQERGTRGESPYDNPVGNESRSGELYTLPVALSLASSQFLSFPLPHPDTSFSQPLLFLTVLTSLPPFASTLQTASRQAGQSCRLLRCDIGRAFYLPAPTFPAREFFFRVSAISLLSLPPSHSHTSTRGAPAEPALWPSQHAPLLPPACRCKSETDPSPSLDSVRTDRQYATTAIQPCTACVGIRTPCALPRCSLPSARRPAGSALTCRLGLGLGASQSVTRRIRPARPGSYRRADRLVDSDLEPLFSWTGSRWLVTRPLIVHSSPLAHSWSDSETSGGEHGEIGDAPLPPPPPVPPDPLRPAESISTVRLQPQYSVSAAVTAASSRGRRGPTGPRLRRKRPPRRFGTRAAGRPSAQPPRACLETRPERGREAGAHCGRHGRRSSFK